MRLVELGGEPVLACWGLTIVVPREYAELASLVMNEMLALRSASRPPRKAIEEVFKAIFQRRTPVSSAEEYLATANEHFRAGRGVEALRDAASVLARTPHGPTTARALKLILGPILKPGGAEALRAALFRA